MASELGVSSKVAPSGGALATASVPMLPPAPLHHEGLAELVLQLLADEAGQGVRRTASRKGDDELDGFGGPGLGVCRGHEGHQSQGGGCGRAQDAAHDPVPPERETPYLQSHPRDDGAAVDHVWRRCRPLARMAPGGSYDRVAGLISAEN